MGLILSQFMKKKTLLERLEDLEEEIQKIKQYSTGLDENLKSANHWILACGSILVLFSSLYIYFFRYPREVFYKLLFACAILSLFTATLFINRITSWYYFRKIKSNSSKIKSLESDKKKLLLEVEEKENYKTAKEILAKFKPEEVRPQVLSLVPSTSKLAPYNKAVPRSASNSGSIITNRLPVVPPSLPSGSKCFNYGGLKNKHVNGQKGPSTISIQFGAPSSTYPLPKSLLERSVEYLLGDGPNHRFALICTKCFSHNGMAIKEEYPFISFKCYVCKEFNPAKQMKLQQPKFDSHRGLPSNKQLDAIELKDDSENESGTDVKEVNDESTSETLSEAKSLLEHIRKCLPKDSIEDTSNGLSKDSNEEISTA